MITVNGFEIMKDNVGFYSLAIEEGWILPDDAYEILSITDSIECRAMLPEYLRNN